MFVHLNNHSDFSLLRSISRVSDIVKKAKALGQEAIAITDYGNMFAVPEFVLQCKQQGIKAIIGCEVTLVENHKIKDNSSRGNLILLCMDERGFGNLKEISTRGYTEGFYYFPRIDMDILQQHHEGLLCIVPQDSSFVSQLLETGRQDPAKKYVQQLKDMFGDRVYLEIQNHGLTSEHNLNRQLAVLADELKVQLVAGNDCHYIDREDSELHTVFIGTAQQRREQFFSNNQYYIKDRKDMEVYLDQYKDALDRTVEVARRCQFDFKFIGAKLPSFELPSPFTEDKEYVRHLALEGIKSKYKEISQEIKERVEFELNIITSMNFSGYFLIVWDIIFYAKSQNIPVGLGRGSAAGSIVAYALGITGVDPLKYGLLFERFLNPERISMPDIDIDFCVERRQEVIDYIKQKYGEAHVGQIITFSHLKPRGAIRDIARSMGVPLEKAEEISKLIPFDAKTLQEAEKKEPKLVELRNTEYASLLNATEKLVGLHRHASLHAAGIVIGASKLTDFVPLYKDPRTGSISTQYSMNYLEDCGLVKVDILGLRTLTILENAIALIREKEKDFDIEQIPENDAETFKMLSRGESDAVFQFESDGMQRSLIKVNPKVIGDLVALNALYRPGPMKSIDDYAQVNQGNRPPQYIDPDLEPILKDTNGIIIYQEQVMEIAQKIAGYSLGNADLLRRAMGKKKAEEMERNLPVFVDGAVALGYDRGKAKNIYEQMAPFAQYGFNKSHAVAYAIIAYQTAYLKRHYPLCYMTSVINSNSNRPDDLSKQLKVCKKMGIRILPPDVNYSHYNFRIEGDALRYGFNAIKSMGDDIKQHIAPERKKNGLYKDMLDVLGRLPSKRGLRPFLKVAIPTGLFDSLDSRREVLDANIENIYNEANERLKAKEESRMLLFSDEVSEEFQLFDLSPEEIKAKEQDMIHAERESLGIHLSRYPLNPYKDMWKNTTTIITNECSIMPAQEKGDDPHYIIAYVDSVHKINKLETSRKLFRMNLEDYLGEMPAMYSSSLTVEDEIEDKTVYGFVGKWSKFENSDEGYFRIQAVMSPEALAAKKKQNHPGRKSLLDIENLPYDEMHLQVSKGFSKVSAEKIKKIFLDFFGTTNVFFHINHRSNKKEVVALPPGFTIDARNPKLCTALASFPEIEEVWYK